MSQTDREVKSDSVGDYMIVTADQPAFARVRQFHSSLISTGYACVCVG